jgi:hypothetical protein
VHPARKKGKETRGPGDKESHSEQRFPWISASDFFLLFNPQSAFLDWSAYYFLTRASTAEDGTRDVKRGEGRASCKKKRIRRQGDRETRRVILNRDSLGYQHLISFCSAIPNPHFLVGPRLIF